MNLRQFAEFAKGDKVEIIRFSNSCPYKWLCDKHCGIFGNRGVIERYVDEYKCYAVTVGNQMLCFIKKEDMKHI